ncbi:hypothetical protein LPJ66_009387 [Kickxella alabastrina]|uniref:Uncharacterized protein n=1 Tax=Kickxella alabastrina TaxID=61397 RepID=A0ACC1I5L2_9FUNG|nr:hypothetical protein LPJ66_009387 [Kickxella alabastrina]
MHDRRRVRVFCYATTAADGSAHRAKIEREAGVFVACAAWPTQRIVERIAADGIHVLVNLNGYTKGARNEIFAARPAPVLVAFMGFAGTLGAGWCDYVVADPVVCPPWTVRSEVRAGRRRRLAAAAAAAAAQGAQGPRPPPPLDFGELDPEEDAGAWVYTERMIYMPHTYFVNDHRQGFREDDELRALAAAPGDALWRAEQDARHRMRRELFPQLGDGVFIFANFNQLYKIDPQLFRLWLRILERAPSAVVWLLRFPAAGEDHLRRVAREWAGDAVAARLVFTDVAPKHMHIKRGRIADAFLDTTECNAHTTAVDILWSGTPVLTWPRHEHKLCSRVAASVVCAAVGADAGQMVVGDAEAYVDRAVRWATEATYTYEYAYPPADAAPAPAPALDAAPAAAPMRGILDPDPQTGLVQHKLCGGPAMDLRFRLFMQRDQSRLFDTQRWTRNLERGLEEAWRRWVAGDDDLIEEEDCDGRDDWDGRDGRDDWDGRDGRDDRDDRDDCDLIGDDVQRRVEWSRWIEDDIAECLAKDPKAPVFAPPGRSIWVCDEDDAMPAQTWVREMLAWNKD